MLLNHLFTLIKWSMVNTENQLIVAVVGFFLRNYLAKQQLVLICEVDFSRLENIIYSVMLYAYFPLLHVNGGCLGLCIRYSFTDK